MANLLKTGARSPRVQDGYTYTGCDYDTFGTREPDGSPPVLYRLTVGNRNGQGAAQFKAEQHIVELTEAEMLETVTEWMKLYTRNRLEERKRQKNGHPVPR